MPTIIEHYIDDERIVKNLTKPDQITSETEWPQFIHPDGGIIKSLLEIFIKTIC